MGRITKRKKPNVESHELMVTLPILNILVKQSFSNAVGFIILSLYLLIDSVFIGNYLSQDGLAAQAVVTTFEYFLNEVLLSAFSVGVTAFIGPELSDKNYEAVSSYASEFFLVCLIYCIVVPILTVPFAREIAILVGANGDEVISYSAHYLTIILSLGPAGYCMNVAFLPLLRSENKTQWAMYIQGTSSILNIIIDAILFPLFNKQLDMYSPALSTSISLWCTGVFLTIALFLKKFPTYIKFSWRKMRVTWNFLWTTIVQALPTVVNALPFVIGQIMANNYIKIYAPERSSQILSIYGISFRYAMFIIEPRVGIHYAFMSIVAYNIGQHEYRRIRALILHSMWISIVVGGIITCVLVALARPLIMLFEKDKEFIDYAVPLLRISYIGYWAGNQVNILSGLKQMEKRPLSAMIYQLLRLAVMIAVTVIIPRVTQVDYIIMQQSITDLICFVPCSFFMFLEQRRYARLAEAQEGNVTKVV